MSGGARGYAERQKKRGEEDERAPGRYTKCKEALCAIVGAHYHRLQKQVWKAKTEPVATGEGQEGEGAQGRSGIQSSQEDTHDVEQDSYTDQQDLASPHSDHSGPHQHHQEGKYDRVLGGPRLEGK